MDIPIENIPWAFRGDLFRYPDNKWPLADREPDNAFLKYLKIHFLGQDFNWEADSLADWNKTLPDAYCLPAMQDAIERFYSHAGYYCSNNEFTFPYFFETFDIRDGLGRLGGIMRRGFGGPRLIQGPMFPGPLMKAYLRHLSNLGKSVIARVNGKTGKPSTETRWVHPRPPAGECVGGTLLPAMRGLSGTKFPLDSKHHADLVKLPHLLIAGSTGSGKSVFLESLILSLAIQNSHNDLQFVLLDPKKVELSRFTGLPHLWNWSCSKEVCDDVQEMPMVLEDLCEAMETRLGMLQSIGARDLGEWNAMRPKEKLPRMMVVIDEFADASLQMGKPFTRPLERLAAKARAAGIHLVLATQKPTRDVVSPLIKANVPGRIAFRVACQTDSRVILDEGGAELLRGQGEGIFKCPGCTLRFVGPWAGDGAVKRTVDKMRPREESVSSQANDLGYDLWRYLVDAAWLSRWLFDPKVPTRFPNVGETIDPRWFEKYDPRGRKAG